ncbi:hypothetical protein ANACOL_01007 [Anaerotruncus colihominis DSM 17241]|uniref:Uncharacterized protein n=1 Tax=Anaerotruncus colihominis DSM 17241 TaxID=445972 RepID=B0P8B8_9FIRM|nr:hypothetical protein ANACOL_01007 [Anaerotruncus colihominis DSM 17241]
MNTPPRRAKGQAGASARDDSHLQRIRHNRQETTFRPHSIILILYNLLKNFARDSCLHALYK